MLQNIFANVLERLTHVEDSRRLHVKQNICETFAKMFYLTCNHRLIGLAIFFILTHVSADLLLW